MKHYGHFTSFVLARLVSLWNAPWESSRSKMCLMTLVTALCCAVVCYTCFGRTVPLLTYLRIIVTWIIPCCDHLRLYITPLAVDCWLRGKDERRRNPKFFTMNHKTFLPADCLLDYTKSMKNDSLMVRHICNVIISLSCYLFFALKMYYGYQSLEWSGGTR